jgi:hypothetical protein
MIYDMYISKYIKSEIARLSSLQKKTLHLVEENNGF